MNEPFINQIWGQSCIALARCQPDSLSTDVRTCRHPQMQAKAVVARRDIHPRRPCAKETSGPVPFGFAGRIAFALVALPFRADKLPGLDAC
jgi:hypothetical protein